MRGPTGVKFCTMVSTRPNFIMPVQNFGGHTPKKFRGRKTCKIWPDFGRLRSSAANIFETDEYIQNLIAIPSITIPSALGQTSPVKFGPVNLEISGPPLQLFLKGESKIGLKCNKGALITSELGGITRRNFGT